MGVISNKNQMKEIWGVSACEICGEGFTNMNEEVAEMYRPDEPTILDEDGLPSLSQHKIGHAIHLQEGWVMS